MRIPKQVLIIPYRTNKNNKIEFCLFERKDLKVWQWISGGAEDFDKDILESAKRELWEETHIKDNVHINQLELITKIPVTNIVKDFIWGRDIFYAEEYAFSVNINNQKITLSEEHIDYKWVSYEEAMKLLKYDSNKSALWELNEKLTKNVDK